MIKKFLAVTFLAALFVVAAGMVSLAIITNKLAKELRDLPANLAVASAPNAFLDREGGYLKSSTRSISVRLEDLPPHIPNAFLASEDASFYSHRGISPKGMARAAINSLRGRQQGGSTITQQVARNLFLTLARTKQRKAKEIILALRMEQRYAKDQILEAYLNSISFGVGVKGIGGASRHFFDKDAEELSIAETATLAGILPRPADWNPLQHPLKADARKKIVLGRMLKCGFISEAQFQTAWIAPIATKPSQGITHATDHFVAMTTEQLPPEVAAASGQQITTTLDMRYQWQLIDVIHEGMAQTDKQLGLKPYNTKLPNAEKDNYPQAAVVVVNPRNGELLAMAGSRELSYGFEFNRTIQPQQPGSTAKIFTYTNGVMRGSLPNSLFCDQPVTVKLSVGDPWSPSNYGDEYHGRITMAGALQKSLNTVAIKIELADTTCADTLNATGNPGPAEIVELARQFGIRSPWPAYPSVAIGAPDATLVEIAFAYAVLASGGVYHQPKLIMAINGRPVKANGASQAISEQEAYIITSMFRNVLQPGGTAWTFYDRAGTGYFPAAGKTGTTNDSRDCWFVLFTPEIVVAVWVGYDDNRPLTKGTGSGSAMPIAAAFIKRVAKYLTKPDFPMPEGVELKKIDSITGEFREDGNMEAAFPIAANEN